uniref:Uncharacterized protein n=1 Tax=Solanum lycopersicum TaxID=4081 RepID=A0A3Q7H8Z0_SOLLC
MNCNSKNKITEKTKTVILNREENPRIILSNFNDLEFDALRNFKNMSFVEIGKLIDLIIDGLVTCIAFGSYSKISRQLIEKIDQGLLKCGRLIWISRVEVLKHPSVSYLITHYKWNLLPVP